MEKQERRILQKISKGMASMNVEEILRGECKGYGTGGHVCVPKKHLGKEVIILVKGKA
jgi:putative transposon-encoded protein